MSEPPPLDVTNTSGDVQQPEEDKQDDLHLNKIQEVLDAARAVNKDLDSIKKEIEGLLPPQTADTASSLASLRTRIRNAVERKGERDEGAGPGEGNEADDKSESIMPAHFMPFFLDQEHNTLLASAASWYDDTLIPISAKPILGTTEPLYQAACEARRARSKLPELEYEVSRLNNIEASQAQEGTIQRQTSRGDKDAEQALSDVLEQKRAARAEQERVAEVVEAEEFLRSSSKSIDERTSSVVSDTGGDDWTKFRDVCNLALDKFSLEHRQEQMLRRAKHLLAVNSGHLKEPSRELVKIAQKVGEKAAALDTRMGAIRDSMADGDVRSATAALRIGQKGVVKMPNGPELSLGVWI